MWESPQAGELWRQGAARRAQALGPATEKMLEAAQLAPGMHVLDVAAGSGDQTLLAARLVGPQGRVLATDISASMLAAAEQAAREQQLANVLIKQADASAIQLAEAHFDAAICRFGLMFVPDLHAALTRIHRALKAGAKFAALVWADEQRNPWMGLQLAVLHAINRPPDPSASLIRALSLSDSAKLQREFEGAGFTDVHVEQVATPREFGSIAEAVEAVRSTSTTQGELTDAERQQYAAELERRLRAYSDAGGAVAIPGEAILVVGTR